MIELTPEMKAAVKRRMGVPDGQEMDPWMGSAIEDVLAIVERDYFVDRRFPLNCDAAGPDGLACQRSPGHPASGHAANSEQGLVRW